MENIAQTKLPNELKKNRTFNIAEIEYFQFHAIPYNENFNLFEFDKKYDDFYFYSTNQMANALWKNFIKTKIKFTRYLDMTSQSNQASFVRMLPKNYDFTELKVLNIKSNGMAIWNCPNLEEVDCITYDFQKQI